MINAAQHPGPALWMGLMLIVLAAWALYLYIGDPKKKEFGLSAGVVVAIGYALFIEIVKSP